MKAALIVIIITFGIIFFAMWVDAHIGYHYIDLDNNKGTSYSCNKRYMTCIDENDGSVITVKKIWNS